MPRITIYVDDRLAAELRRHAGANVSAFVAKVLTEELLGRRFDEGLALLAQLPADPDQDPLTDRASVLRAVEETRRPWAPARPQPEAGPNSHPSAVGGPAGQGR